MPPFTVIISSVNTSLIICDILLKKMKMHTRDNLEPSSRMELLLMASKECIPRHMLQSEKTPPEPRNLQRRSPRRDGPQRGLPTTREKKRLQRAKKPSFLNSKI